MDAVSSQSLGGMSFYSHHPPHSPSATRGLAPDLPLDVLVQVAGEVARQPARQHALYVFCLVARLWYDAAVELLYTAPLLAGRNYLLFVHTICPSINLHVRPSEVAPFVRILDLSKLVHEGSRTVTGRLLGRVKHTLETLVAPQTSFAINSLPALSKCHHLTRLDLSLISAAPPLADLVRTINKLRRLKVFHFPRCQVLQSPGIQNHILRCLRENNCAVCHSVVSIFPRWSDYLEAVHIPCDIKDAFLSMFARMPPSMKTLAIEDGSIYNISVVDTILRCIGPQILSLKLRFGLPKSGFRHDRTPQPRFPILRHLDCTADHLLMRFFHFPTASTEPIPLQSLTIHHVPGPVVGMLSCSYLFDQVADGHLQNLRKVKLDKALGWDTTHEGRQEAEELSEFLQVLAREDVEAREPALDEEAVLREVDTSQAGVWFFGEGVALEQPAKAKVMQRRSESSMLRYETTMQDQAERRMTSIARRLLR